MSLIRKNLTWNIPFFGIGTIFFGVGAENFTAQAKQYTVFVKFLGGKPIFSTEEAKNIADEADVFAEEAKRITTGAKNTTPTVNQFTPEAENTTTVVHKFTAEANNITTEANHFTTDVKNTTTDGEILVKNINHLGLQSKELKPEIKIFTFGLFVLKINSRIRAGFVKRHQILVEA